MRLSIWVAALLLSWAGLATGAVNAHKAVKQLVASGVQEPDARLVVEQWVEKDGQADPEALVEVVRRASAAGAPVDLVVDKALEGLAKGVMGERLLRVLDDWGADLGQAAQLFQGIREEIDSAGISEQEAILRLGILQQGRKDGSWLLQLRQEARQNKVDLPGLLRIGEAVNHLAKLGLEEQAAEDLGTAWMKEGVPSKEVGKLVRAIEVGREWMSPSQAAKEVSEGMSRGMSSDDLLRGMEREREKRGKHEASTLERGQQNPPGQAPARESQPKEKGKGEEKEKSTKRRRS